MWPAGLTTVVGPSIDIGGYATYPPWDDDTTGQDRTEQRLRQFPSATLQWEREGVMFPVSGRY